jgi:ferredoxin
MTDLFEVPEEDSDEGRLLALHNAAEAGHLSTVQKLLAAGVSANAADSLVRARLPHHPVCTRGVRCALCHGNADGGGQRAPSSLVALEAAAAGLEPGG